jgi:hypothetical protein
MNAPGDKTCSTKEPTTHGTIEIRRLVLHLCLRVTTVAFNLFDSDDWLLVQLPRRLLRLSVVKPGSPIVRVTARKD